MEQALDKIGSFDVSKVVLDINSHKVYESMFAPIMLNDMSVL